MRVDAEELSDEVTRTVKLLWERRPRPARGPKPSMTVDRIVRSAIEIADSEGLQALSIGRLASALGFAKMGVYRYIAGKSDLLSLMLDKALDPSPDLDAVEGGWRPKLEAWADAYSAVLRAHPWSNAAAAIGRVMGPHELAWLEAAMGALAGTGLTGAEKADAVVAVNGHVRSWQLYAPSQNGLPPLIDPDRWSATMAGLVRQYQSRFPALLNAMHSGAFGSGDEDGRQFGLRVVLDGIGVSIALRAEEAGPRAEEPPVRGLSGPS